MKINVIEYAKKALIDELYTSAIYSKLAKIYGKSPLSKKLLEMSEMESRHAEIWLDFS